MGLVCISLPLGMACQSTETAFSIWKHVIPYSLHRTWIHKKNIPEKYCLPAVLWTYTRHLPDNRLHMTMWMCIGLMNNHEGVSLTPVILLVVFEESCLENVVQQLKNLLIIKTLHITWRVIKKTHNYSLHIDVKFI